MAAVSLNYTASLSDLDGAAKRILIGSAEKLAERRPESLSETHWDALLNKLKGGDFGTTRSTYTGDESMPELVLIALPEKVSRHIAPARPHAIHQSLMGAAAGSGDLAIHVLVDEDEHAFASALAVARCFPTFSRKSKSDEEPEEKRTAHILIEGPSGVIEPSTRMIEGGNSVRLAAHWVDAPCADFNTHGFIAAAEAVAKETGCGIEIIQGDELVERGYGGLHTVGKAAEAGPALVILKHEPEGAERSIAMVGKGMVYDTGGLSLKVGGNMVGMKSDMGGAAGVLAGFRAASLAGCKDKLYALLCLAENAVDERAGRPDDIHQSYSGKTVEVNNTDAEGRLVLADGLAHAAKHLSPDLMLDMATLTGAQLVATGRRHAALYCNDDELEAAAMAAGKRSGDLAHPLPYAPEFYTGDYKSQVADLRNTTSDRMNASSASAGWFLSNHLCDYKGPWIHVDIAGPVTHKDRATGFGVGLLMELFVPA